MDGLLSEYRYSLRQVNRLIRQRGIEREQKHTKTYKIKGKQITSETKSKKPVTDEERILHSCVDSLTYVVEWLDRGRPPDARRGVYGKRREIPMDPQSYQFIRIAVAQKAAEQRVTQDQRELLDDLLDTLTFHEREAFILVRGRNWSFSQAAKLLDVKKGTVQVWVERAETKLKFTTGAGVQRVMFPGD